VFLELRGSAKKTELLYRVHSDYDHRLSEYKFIRRCSQPAAPTRCLVQMMAEALGKEDVSTSHIHRPSVCSDFVSVQTSLSKVTEELGTEIVLVCHQGDKVRGQSPFHKDNQLFGILAANKFNRDTPVLVLTADRKFVYLLHDKYAADVLSQTPRKRNMRFNSIGAHRGSAKYEGELHAEEPSRKKFKPTSVTEVSDGCTCDPCLNEHVFSNRMARRGPQRLYKIRMSSMDHLRFFGLLSASTEAMILRASEFSIGSFDTESITVYLDKDESNSDLFFGVDPVSRQKLPRVAFARQTPVLLSWTDYFRYSQGEPRFCYRLEDEDTETFAGHFVEDILTSRDEAVVAKYEILQSLFSWLEVFKKAHHAHYGVTLEDEEDEEEEEAEDNNAVTDEDYGGGGVCEDEEDDDDDNEAVGSREKEEEERNALDPAADEEKKRKRRVRQAYRLSMFGLFEKQLEDLARRYVIFGLNAEVGSFFGTGKSLMTFFKKLLTPSLLKLELFVFTTRKVYGKSSFFLSYQKHQKPPRGLRPPTFDVVYHRVPKEHGKDKDPPKQGGLSS
jgi:hypothetical protein